MKRIDRYVMKEMFLPVIFGISLITFALMIDIIKALKKINLKYLQLIN